MSYAFGGKGGTRWRIPGVRHLPSPPPPPILGSSSALRRALDDADRVARTRAPVLIGGETGTGKELLARRLHAASGRAGEFVAVNCATIPEQLAESTLFGHKRGAFTGATDANKGLVRAAHGGTLFLDEVGDLPPPMQTRLLRVLQEGTVVPVGETADVRVDVRVVAATHRDLRRMVTDGTFREDLYFRLAMYEVVLPPLRERGRDVVTIARALLAGGIHGARPCSLSRTAEAVLVGQAWPGNVRELEGVLFRAAIRADGRSVGAGDLCEHVRSEVPAAQPVTMRVLELLKGGPTPAADVAASLNLSKTTTHRVLSAMVQAGDVVVEGAGKATRYRLPMAEDVTDPRERVAMRIIERDGRVTRSCLSREAAISVRTAARVLGELVRRRLVVSDGLGGRFGGYSTGGGALRSPGEANSPV